MKSCLDMLETSIDRSRQERIEYTILNKSGTPQDVEKLRIITQGAIPWTDLQSPSNCASMRSNRQMAGFSTPGASYDQKYIPSACVTGITKTMQLFVKIDAC